MTDKTEGFERDVKSLIKEVTDEAMPKRVSERWGSSGSLTRRKAIGFNKCLDEFKSNLKKMGVK